MQATFWIETVQYELEVPAWKPGHPAMLIQAPVPKGNTSGVPTPTFLVQPPHEITTPQTITASATQIQYSQLVNLVFAGLIWPHSSHATLVPMAPVVVPASAFGAAEPTPANGDGKVDEVPANQTPANGTVKEVPVDGNGAEALVVCEQD